MEQNKQDTEERKIELKESSATKKPLIDNNMMLIAGAVIFLMVGILAAVLILGNSSKSEEDQIKDDIIAFAEKYGYEDEIGNIDEQYELLKQQGIIDDYKKLKKSGEVDSFLELLSLNAPDPKQDSTANSFSETRDAKRNAQINEISNALVIHLTDPANSLEGFGIPSCNEPAFIGTGEGNVDLSLLVTVGLISELPNDPQAALEDGSNTEYTICLEDDGRVTITAPNAETELIEISR